MEILIVDVPLSEMMKLTPESKDIVQTQGTLLQASYIFRIRTSQKWWNENRHFLDGLKYKEHVFVED